MTETAKSRLSPSVILLALFALLLPLIGGQLGNDVVTLEPGAGAFFAAMFRGVEVGTFQHGLLAAIVSSAFIILLVKRKILQVPQIWISAPLAAFVALLIASVFLSAHRWQSQTALAEWITYAVIVFTVVAGAGRKRGPIAILTALAAGSTITALLGLVEYGGMKAQDPGWRIFGGWYNPNALAGMMLIGLVLCIGLISVAPTSGSRLIAGVGAVLNGLALFLTGSKGGVLSAGVALLVLLVLVIAWGGQQRMRLLSAGVVVVVLTAGFFFLIQKTAAPPGGGAATRLTSAGATQEQSSGFRLQLWKGAAELLKEQPVGRGIGTYAFYSAKPGLTTRTELAHQSWLQLAVEAGILAPLILILLLCAWLVQCFRSARSLPVENNLLRAAIIAAVAGTVAHGFIESNLYYFGLGATLFLLLGVGLQLSADASAPEFTALPLRIAAISLAAVAAGQLLFAGYIGKVEANLRYSIASSQFADAEADLATLKSLASSDGETWYRAGLLSRSSEEAVANLKRAIDASPSAKYYRALARAQIRAGQTGEAQTSLQMALSLDPNNLSALLQIMQMEAQSGATEDAARTAERLLAVEDTPYFKIRSLPELIPTETYQARIFLASRATDPKHKTELLQGAADGLRQFARVTVPYTLQMSGGEPTGGATPSADEMRKMLELGKKALKDLRSLYPGKSEKLHRLDEAEADFDKALGSIK